jgi:hypothetical protein
MAKGRKTGGRQAGTMNAATRGWQGAAVAGETPIRAAVLIGDTDPQAVKKSEKAVASR